MLKVFNKCIFSFLVCLISFLIFSEVVFADDKPCNQYASQGESVCESKTYNGKKCAWDGTKKGGSRCYNSGKIAESKKENITSCSQINDRETCVSSKIDGHECIWRQNACYANNMINDGSNETIIADDEEQRQNSENTNNESQNNVNSEGNGTNSANTLNCNSWGDVKTDLQNVFNFMKFLVPLLVVGLSTYDFIKAITQKDEKDIKKAFTKLIKRMAIAIIFFFLPVILNLILELLETNSEVCIK